MFPLNKRRLVVNGYLHRYCADYNLGLAHLQCYHTEQGCRIGWADWSRRRKCIHGSSGRRTHLILDYHCLERYLLCPCHNASDDFLIEWTSSERPFDPRGLIARGWKWASLFVYETITL